MTTKKYLSAFMALIISLSVCACSDNASSDNISSDNISSDNVSSDNTSSASDTESTSSESESPYLADLTKGYSDDVSAKFEASDGWSNGSMFNCTWRKRNVTFEQGGMKLSIDSDMGDIPYSGGEFRSKDFYGFGYYETKMKPISNSGVVSSFFTYTGPSDNNPWDEIDIEFLGKDTTKVQFNYFTDGKGNHEHLYDLGFDASEEFHTYGFLWQTDSITWYVDGEAVYTATENIPQTPSKIMLNTWPGTGVDGWLGAFDGTVPLTAEYHFIDFREEV